MLYYAPVVLAESKRLIDTMTGFGVQAKKFEKNQT
jgi:hypothetical protein